MGAITVGGPRDLVGERFPAVPPSACRNCCGAATRSWTPGWTSRRCSPSRHRRSTLRRIVREARASGFLIERLTEAPAARNDVLADLVTSGMSEAVITTLRRYLPDVDWAEFTASVPEGTTDVGTIHAPVHDHHGNQRYTISVVAGRRRVPARTCAMWTRAIADRAREASAAIGGQSPWER
ncbi:hypothetical protein ACU686_24470 [Yinghuangia aomiensis]